MTVKDRVIERLIEAGRLTDEEAMSRPHIEVELSALLEEASGLLA